MITTRFFFFAIYLWFFLNKLSINCYCFYLYSELVSIHGSCLIMTCLFFIFFFFVNLMMNDYVISFFLFFLTQMITTSFFFAIYFWFFELIFYFTCVGWASFIVTEMNLKKKGEMAGYLEHCKN